MTINQCLPYRLFPYFLLLHNLSHLDVFLASSVVFNTSPLLVWISPLWSTMHVNTCITLALLIGLRSNTCVVVLKGTLTYSLLLHKTLALSLHAFSNVE